MEILQTERLIFRTWKVEDLAFANELWGDSDVMAFLNVDGSLDSNQVHEKLKMKFQTKTKIIFNIGQYLKRLRVIL